MHNESIGLLRRLREAGVDVKELASDSRAVRRGDVFLAWPGTRHDARAHIAEAIGRGAAAVLWERTGFEWNAGWRVPNHGVDQLRSMAGFLAHEVYGRPSERLWTIGVTGTNGKTSCTQWLAQACGACGARTAVIGTLGAGFPGGLEPLANTTPDAVLLQRTLAGLLASGAQGVAMEVSSIGLDQGRVGGIAFGAALFTNLSRDHIDYHGDMERYAEAKHALFRTPGLRHAVLNVDDVQGVQISRMLAGGGVNRIGYSCHPGVAAHAGLEGYAEAHEIELTARGIAFIARTAWGEARIRTRLLARYNVANLLGVLATMLVSGIPLERAAAALEELSPVSGRLERHGGGALPEVVVDYAHSPDALDQVLQALRELAAPGGGRLTVVFGCGGERDRGKRALMGIAAARHADRVILTSDNPRSEDPQAIIDEIASGVSGRCESIPDRAAAVDAAISAARPGDVVLLAGKGHETWQEIGDRRIEYSDAAQAEAALAGWGR